VSTTSSKRRLSRKKTDSTRVNLRVNSADKKRLLQAAKLAGGNLTGFILSSSLTAADLLLASRTQFSIPEDKWIKFNEMLDAPPRDLPELKRLLAEPSIFTAR
jgi:uncharacterized protein (DUF1778 family)